jgi:hypothetical protein
MEFHNPGDRALRSFALDGAAVARHPLALVAVACLAAAVATSAHAKGGAPKPSWCTQTAVLQMAACGNEVKDDFFAASAICLNLADPAEREACQDDAEDGFGEASQLCKDQLAARRDVCKKIGEGRYDPDFDPAHFDDDFTALTMPNPFQPLAIGNHWEYEGGDETIVIDVLDQTKEIEGVTCIVVRDTVYEDGDLVEDTDDWFAQNENGDVHYCGEISKNYEFFDGDDPELAELVDIEGSWKAGRDGAKPGLLVPKDPEVGDTYRQEWAPGNAEDMATVLSTTYGYGNDPVLDQLVPQDLAEDLCDDDCRVTREFSPLSPGGFERKYYAPGIGLFLEVHPGSGEVVELTGCNFHPSCP